MRWIAEWITWPVFFYECSHRLDDAKDENSNMENRSMKKIKLGDLLSVIKTTPNGFMLHVDVDPGDGTLLQATVDSILVGKVSMYVSVTPEKKTRDAV